MYKTLAACIVGTPASQLGDIEVMGYRIKGCRIVQKLDEMVLENPAGTTGAELFQATLDNVQHLLKILRAIHFKDKALCSITQEGLKFVVEEFNCLRGTAYFQQSAFRSYSYDSEEPLEFAINLNTLVECLSIFGVSVNHPTDGCSLSASKSITSLKMSCNGYGQNLNLLLEDNGVYTVCKLIPFEPEHFAEFEYDTESSQYKLIMSSEWLRDTFKELDSSSEKITLTVSPVDPFFKVTSFGMCGSTEVEYPRDGDVIESFYCNNSHTESFNFNLVIYALKALHLSSKTSVRCDQHGTLSLQFMIPVVGKEVTFVEFVVKSLANELQT